MSTVNPVLAADSDGERTAQLRSIIAATQEVIASVSEQNEEVQSLLEEVASNLADLQTENRKLRAALEELAAVTTDLRELTETALALAAGEGSRSAGRMLATFKASRLAANQEARP